MAVPEATIHVQKRGEANEIGEVESYELGTASRFNPTGYSFKAVISYAATEEGGKGTLALEIPDIPFSAIQEFANSGIMRLDAGYRDDAYAPVRPIFSGFLRTAELAYEGGRAMWEIAASADPSSVLAIGTGASAGEGETISAAEAFRRIGRDTGIIFRIPAVLETVELEEGWRPKRRVAEALDELMAKVRSTLEERTGEKYPITYTYLEEQPYQINIIDWLETPTDQVEYVDYDVTDKSVYTAKPNIVLGTTDPTAGGDIGEDDEGLLDADATALENQFEMSMVFDPRIREGLFVRAIDPENNLTYVFRVAGHKHTLDSKNLDNWKTECTGILLEGHSIEAV